MANLKLKLEIEEMLNAFVKQEKEKNEKRSIFKVLYWFLSGSASYRKDLYSTMEEEVRFGLLLLLLL